MTAFGSVSMTTQDQANNALYKAVVSAGYTPASGLSHTFGILAGTIGTMLYDAVPAPVGTSALPGLMFAGDADTGFFRVGANEVGVAASAANVGGFTSSGFKAGNTSSTPITQFVVYSVSLVPTEISISTISEVTFAVTGLTTADAVFVNPPAVSNNVAAGSWRVSSSGILSGAFVCRGASNAASSGTHKIVAVRT